MLLIHTEQTTDIMTSPGIIMKYLWQEMSIMISIVLEKATMSLGVMTFILEVGVLMIDTMSAYQTVTASWETKFGGSSIPP